MEWRTHVRSEAEWRKQKWKWKNGMEDIIKVWKAKGSVGRRKSQNWKEQNQRLAYCDK